MSNSMRLRVDTNKWNQNWGKLIEGQESCVQYRPARKNVELCHTKLRLDLLGPIRNWSEEIELIRCIHLICMLEFLMAYTSRCRPE